MKKLLAIILAAVTALAVLSLAGCGKKEEAATDLDYVKEKGVLIVGITEYPPMNYKDDNGNWTGFDTELTQAFAEKIGVEVEFTVLTDWSKKFIELDSKSIDCVWNGMTITDEALNNASVSDVYLTTSQVVVLPKDKAATMTTVDAIKSLTFAVEDGSEGQSKGQENGLNTVAVQDMAKALLEVKAGTCDGCIIDKTMADATINAGKSYSDLAIAVTLSTDEFGVAFREESNITAEFNAFLKEYKDSGELAKLAEKYGV